MTKHKRFPMLLIGLALLLASSVVACETLTEPEVVHYASEEFGYSIDYPQGWDLVQLNPNEIVIGPPDSKYDQIQISAKPGEPRIGLLPESVIADSIEANLQEFFGRLGGTNLNVSKNEPVSGKWDWAVAFTFAHQDTALEGEMVIKETESVYYSLTVISVLGVDWPEGEVVVDSFRLVAEPIENI